jgi:phosphoglycolate phosphatase
MDAWLFDLDGTLVDSRVDIAVSANHARATVGLGPRPQEEIFGFIGEGAERLIERTLGPGLAARVPAALAAWREHYERHMLDHTRLYPGVLEALQALDGPRAIVTNKPGPSARQLVQALGLDRLCPLVVGGGDVPEKKPDPASVRLALSRMGADGRAVLVGDSRIDAATARAAGIGFVGVLWGLGSREEMEREGGRIFVERAGELPQACRRALER